MNQNKTQKTIVPLKTKLLIDLAITLQKIDSRVDIIEIWLDELLEDLKKNPEKISSFKNTIDQIKKTQSVSFLAVCKTEDEQGSFCGTPLEKLKIFNYFLDLGGDFVDFDISRNSPNIINTVNPEKLWLSFHDFDGLPKNLEAIFEDMQKLNPYLYKFAVTTHNQLDLEMFLDWAEKTKEKHPNKRFIFTTMGNLGSEGRLILEKKNLTWGGFFALDKANQTASGQRLISDL